MVELALLGTPMFIVDEKQVRLRPRAASLIGYLVYHRSEPRSRADVAAAIWPDELEDTGRANLRRHLHVIATTLGPSIINDRDGWLQFTGDRDVRVDLIEYQRAGAIPAEFETAAALYRGEFLAGTDAEWADSARHAFAHTNTELLLKIAQRKLSSNDYHRAIDALEKALAIDEWREDAVRLAMYARYRAGDRVGALATYDAFETKLHAGLGIAPMSETTSLRSAIEKDVVVDALMHSNADIVSSRDLLPFVGRGPEIRRLRAAWNNAVRGAGSTIFIQGEPGIGKSRLANEFASIIRSEGAAVLLGATTDPQAEPFQPIAAAMRQSLPLLSEANVEDVWLAALGDLLPEVFALRPNMAPLESLDPANATVRLQEGLVRLFQGIADVKPLLLIFEDLQWADEETLALFGVLASRARSLPLLILATVRTTGDESTALIATRSELLNAQRGSIVGLGPLNEESLRQVSPSSIKSESLAELVAIAGGNPLFVSLLMQAFAADRLPVERGPLSLDSAIEMRLQTLSEQSVHVAQAASAIGAAFDPSMLARILGWNDAEVLDAFDQLVDAGIVRELAAPLKYAFSHALIERYLYDRIDPSIKPLRHRRIAAVLETTERSYSPLLASHWAAAGEREKARAAYRRALDYALSTFAWHVARQYAFAALELCATEEHCFEILSALMQADRAAGDFEAWKMDLDALEASASQLSVASRLTALIERTAYWQQIGDRSKQHAGAEEIVALATKHGLVQHRLRGLFALGDAYDDVGKYSESALVFEELLAGPVDTLPKDLQLKIFQMYGFVLYHLGRMDDAAAFLEHTQIMSGMEEKQALVHFAYLRVALAMTGRASIESATTLMKDLVAQIRQRGDMLAERQAQFGLALALWSRPDEARAAYERAEAISLNLNDSSIGRVVGVGNRGFLECELGRFDLALTFAQQARTLAVDASSPGYLARGIACEAMATLGLGDLVAAQALSNLALEHARKLEEPVRMATALATQAAVRIAAGDDAGAIDALNGAIQERRKAGRDAELAGDFAMLAQAQLHMGNIDEARATVSQIEAMNTQRLLQVTKICAVCAEVHSAANDEKSALRWTERGLAEIANTLEHISDPQTCDAYRGLPHNKWLLSRLPAHRTPKNRRPAHSSPQRFR